MPPVTTREKLTKLYPTLESLEKARKNYKSWRHMSEALGMHPQSLADYRKEIGASGKPGKIKDILALTAEEIDQGIRRLLGDKTANVVTKYKIVEPELFYEDTCGNEGLELVGTERGTPFNQAWQDWHLGEI
jgi:hypothetical protein